MRSERFSPIRSCPLFWGALLLLLSLGSCSRPPQPRIDGREVTGPPEELLPLDDEGIPVDDAGPAELSLDQLEGDQLIRVGLATGLPEATLRVWDSVEILGLDGRRRARGAGAGKLTVRLAARGLTLDGPGLDAVGVVGKGVLLKVKGDGAHFSAKGNDYAGEMLILKQGDGRLSLINIVDLETYLRGVVPWEIGRPGKESLEAVKAQAIAARSYTIAHLGRRSQLGFDVWDGVGDQVYRGLTGVHEVTDLAVKRTREKVLFYEGKIVQAYYCSTCGGHTASIQDVWPRSAVPYLQGVKDAPRNEGAWCRLSPHFRWTVAWSAHRLGDILREHLFEEAEDGVAPGEMGVLTGLRVVEHDESGRVHRLRVLTDRGQWDVVGDRIRWVLRPVGGRFKILRSTLFRIEEYRNDEGKLIGIRLQGGGFGHGVGMCQSGALAMARAGRSAEQILKHYYHGVHIESLRGGRSDWEEKLP